MLSETFLYVRVCGEASEARRSTNLLYLCVCVCVDICVLLQCYSVWTAVYAPKARVRMPCLPR